ncbi:sugar phosphate isomerase/epimerase family protein [Paenirhodobacter populi]|uniref:sugar phosphate isomerase/epimerase family protein n=1 Tax=Paenirhodobacter populi TaxID=2306993 RepID=UPI000FE37428|nr:sugar phosphate isomerase/epimerase family protein [Sinirhodobacter populi]RWR09150.1 sugar phosphate isomerase/epimerase [Sinirhodobacter populi]
MRDFTKDHSALALNTATLGHNVDGAGAGWSPERTIDACAARGYGGIVFWRRELAGRAAAIGAHARAAGVAVAGLCRTPFLVGPLAPVGAQAVMDDFRASIDMAAEVGAPVLTIVVGGVEPGTKGVARSLGLVTERIAAALDHAAAQGVRLAIEPLHPVYAGDRSCLTTLRDALDICDRIGSPHLGVAVDVYHVWWDTDLPAQLARAGERILGYHLCDWLAGTRDVLLDRGMMGDGVADLKGLRAAVEDAGYDGLCEVEIFSADNWWKRDPGEVLDTIVTRFRTVC